MLSNLKGFTLIEVMLSLALLGIIGGISAPMYQSFQNQNQLTVAATTVTQSLRRAQSLARASDGDSRWGVYVQSGSVILFRGDDFSDRDPVFDEETVIADSINISGSQEYVFAKLSGLPEADGSTTLTGPAGGQQEVVVNEEGMVSY